MPAPLAKWTAWLGARLLSSSSQSSEHNHEEDVTDQGVGALIFALAIGVVARSYLRSVIPLPYTVQVLVVGIGIGLILEHTDEAGLGHDLSVSLDSVRFMNPEIIFYALLPILIFESAFFTDVHIFLREMWQVMMLAGPGVVVATTLMACFAKFVFPYGWDWKIALFFGAMTSATDPVAVVALMKELGVSERLAVLIEGESLLNDGTSIVVFSVFFNAASGQGTASVATVATQALRLGVGGPVVGLLTGAIGAFFVGYILEDHLSEIACTVIVCFIAFLLAEATILKVSGVLAVVVGGLYMSFYGRPRISPSVQEPLHAFWSLWGYMANTIIFFVTGLTAATKAFGKGSSIDARDWGYLLALYVAVHIVRGLVVLMSYPVLRHGYGTNWKQLVVLTYAGLRGAVGLTLALIVQENPNIDEEVGDKVMFMMAGLAIMTLLINGTTCGKLMHNFGMDRATKAQTEIFIRACSAVESKLEHVVEELKKDRFLGDSDWPVVWRYMPVMTSRVYWHRIRYGSVILANGEEEEIQAASSNGHGMRSPACQGCCGMGAATGGAFQGTLASISGTWRWGRASEGGGGRFAHLPPRLRVTWARYHRRFHITEEVEEEGGVDRLIESNIMGEHGNEHYRSLDQTVHMPSTGRMRDAAEFPHTSASGTMPNKSVREGIRSLFSQLTQGVGTRNGSRHPLGLDASVRGGERGSGTGGDDGDRTTRRGLGLRGATSHDNLARAGSGGGNDPLGSRGSRGIVPIPSRRPSGSSSLGGFVSSMTALDKAGTTAAAAGSSRRYSTAALSSLSHGSQHRLASAAAAAAAAAHDKDGPRATGWRSVDVRALKEIEVTKSGLSLAKEHLQHVEAKLNLAVRDAEKLTEKRRSAQSQAGAGQGTSGSPGGIRSSPGSHPAPGESGRTSAAKTALQGSHHREPAADHQEQLAEARLRFMAAVKANYQENFRKGWLSDSGLRVLQGNADVQLDAGHLPLQEWTRLRDSFTIPSYQLNLASALRYLPFLGHVVGGWIFKKLAFVFELASNFIAAHEDIAILELLPEGDAADQLAKENLKQLADASDTLGQQLPAFPEVARSLKTQVAARFLLAKHREFVEELYLDGFINEKERESILHVNTEIKIKLDDHPYAEHLPPKERMLARVPFLKTLSDDHVARILNDDTFCYEEFHGSNVVLLRQGERVKHSGHRKGTGGWYYIVRGSVQMVTVSQERNKNNRKDREEGALGSTGDSTVVPSTEGLGDEAGNAGMKVREHTLHAGAVFGMTDMMLGMPFRASYTTGSFVHLFFFDRSAFLDECTRSDDLNRALWRTVGVSVLRKFYGFHNMSLQELQKMVMSSEFVDLGADGVGEETTQIEYKVEEIRAKAASRERKQLASQSQLHPLSAPTSTSSLDNLSMPSGATASRAVSGASGAMSGNSVATGSSSMCDAMEDDDDGRIHVHKLQTSGRAASLAKTLSNMGLYDMGSIPDATLAAAATVLTPHSTSTQALKVVDIEPLRLLLLVKGQLLPRPNRDELPGVEMHTAPCLLTHVSGRLVFTKDTKMFLIPLGVVERTRTSFGDRRTRLEKATHREHTIKDLNEHRGPGARRMSSEGLERVAQDALGARGRTDLGARQALTRTHSEMARRAAERDISLGEDPSGTESLAVQRVGLASGPRGEDGGGAPGGGSAAGVPGGGDVIGETFARRRSFVAKRGWGSMKLVEVDEEPSPGNQHHLTRILEERERSASAASARGTQLDTPGGGSSGILPWRPRLGSSQRRSGRVGRLGSGSSARETDVDEEKVQEHGGVHGK